MQNTRFRTLIIGAGSWGTALANIAAYSSDVLIWTRDGSQADHINNLHRNPKYLSEYPLNANIIATTSIDEAVQFVGKDSLNSAFVIFGLPVVAMREHCKLWFQALGKENINIPVVWTCKGFESDTGLLPHEIVLQTTQFTNYGVLSGPSFAREVIQNMPVALTIASQSESVIKRAMDILHHSNSRIYSTKDIIGVEVGGALKNIIAIACGISDALGLGLNARAALITRGLHEISRLGQALGADAQTFYGLTGLGDLVLTATGDLSRNRQVGLAIGKGQKLSEILHSKITAEGVRCAEITIKRAKNLGIEMPITEAICQVLFHDKPAIEAVKSLLMRNAKDEKK